MKSTKISDFMVKLGERNTNAGAVLEAPASVTQEVVTPMCSQDTPTPTEDTTEEIPYGYCHCGCGEKTSVAKRTYSHAGLRKGEHYRYVANHDKRSVTNREDPNPSGLCQCGCGQPTSVIGAAQFTHSRFVEGHQYRRPPQPLMHNSNGTISINLRDDIWLVADECDLDLLAQHRWHLHRSNSGLVYAIARDPARPANEQARIRAHRLILAAQPSEFVDHINGNGLDCRRANLRICTKQQNAQNRTRIQSEGFKGVHRLSGQERWLAIITHCGVKHWLGRFDSPEEAARAYDRAARELYGAFATLNFPVSGERSAITGEVRRAV